MERSDGLGAGDGERPEEGLGTAGLIPGALEKASDETFPRREALK